MTMREVPLRRRDDISEWHDLSPANCETCGCTFFFAKDDPDIVWDPGRAWDDDCRDRSCACHEEPVVGMRRSGEPL
jgi:hypothetical protein